MHRAVHGRRRRLAARRRDREPRAADALGARHADQGHPGRRAGLCLAGRRHHPDGRRGADAGEELRLRADAGAGGADRVHPARVATMRRSAAMPRAPSRWTIGAARPTRCGSNDRRAAPARRPPAPAARPDRPDHRGVRRAATRSSAAYRQAVDRFGDILPTLVRELPTLRRPVGEPIRCCRARSRAAWPRPCGRTAPSSSRRWPRSPAPSPTRCCRRCCAGRTLDKAYVNDGGDIAIHLAPGHSLRAGIFAEALDGAVTPDARPPGARHRHLGPRRPLASRSASPTARPCSRATAAAADAAATLIANAVDIDHPAIERRPARELDPDSDLGDLPVTVAVGASAARRHRRRRSTAALAEAAGCGSSA